MAATSGRGLSGGGEYTAADWSSGNCQSTVALHNVAGHRPPTAHASHYSLLIGRRPCHVTCCGRGYLFIRSVFNVLRLVPC